MSGTRDAIVDAAVDLFNAHGLENVGMRELARALDLSPGTLTYHFPRKEDVVDAVLERLAERTGATLRGRGPDSFAAFLDALRGVFRDQHAFRCLPLALVHLYDTYPELRPRLARSVALPRARLDALLRRLRDLGYLRIDTTSDELARLVDTCALISRFWLSDVRLDHAELPADEAIEHYVGFVAGAFVPFATERGRAELVSGTERRAERGPANP